MARAIPKGFRTITPGLIVRDARKAIEFYKAAFGAKQTEIHYDEDGKVMHATLKIGDSMVFLSDEMPGVSKSPEALGGNATVMNVYVKDADEAFGKALNAGATVAMPLEDQFWGDRFGQVMDPFGHRWSIMTHIRDMSQKEIEEAGREAMADMRAKMEAQKRSVAAK